MFKHAEILEAAALELAGVQTLIDGLVAQSTETSPALATLNGDIGDVFEAIEEVAAWMKGNAGKDDTPDEAPDSCPLCGNNYVEVLQAETGTWGVCCDFCNANIYGYKTRETAVKQWNHRHRPDMEGR